MIREHWEQNSGSQHLSVQIVMPSRYRCGLSSPVVSSAVPDAVLTDVLGERTEAFFRIFHHDPFIPLPGRDGFEAQAAPMLDAGTGIPPSTRFGLLLSR